MAWYMGTDDPPPKVPSEVEEIMEDNGDHGLLTERTYNFSLLTRQRALIAWIGTGRKNQYFAVCRYYHFLEEYENTLSPEARERSRTLEFKNLPNLPQADLLQQVIPTLISQPPPTYADPSTSRYMSEAMASFTPRYVTSETVLPSTSRYIPPDSNPSATPRYTSSQTILPASILITNYLQEYKIDMATFLREFEEYSDREGLSPSLNHLLHFINLKTGKAKKKEPEPAATKSKPAERNNEYEELNNSFNNLYFEPNAKANTAKPPPVGTKQKNNKHLKQSNKSNVPSSPGGPGPSEAFVNGGSPKNHGGKQAKPKANGADKENINTDIKKNYAEVARKHGNKHNLSNSSNCD